MNVMPGNPPVPSVSWRSVSGRSTLTFSPTNQQFALFFYTGKRNGGGRKEKHDERTNLSLINPQRYATQDFLANGLACYRGREELPVCFGVHMPAIEREAVALEHDGVPIALSFVNAAGYEAGFVAGAAAAMARWVLGV